MKQAVAIRHVEFENLGSLEVTLREEGYVVQYVEAARTDLAEFDPTSPELLVVLGGPIGAYEEDNYPFINIELGIIKERLEARLPLLGICLGAQLMARALGAKVYSGTEGKEIGWAPLQLTLAGRKHPLHYLEPETNPVLHWHGDTFDIPSGTELLASTPRYKNQAFSIDKYGLALQFHPEVTVAGMEQWFIGHAYEIAKTSDVSVQQLRVNTKRYGDSLEYRSRKFFIEWLRQVNSSDL